MLDPADTKPAATTVGPDEDAPTAAPASALPTPRGPSSALAPAGDTAAWLGLVCGIIEGSARGAVFRAQYPSPTARPRWHAVAVWPVDETDIERLEAVAEAAGDKGRTVVRPHAKPDGADAADVHDLAHPLIGGDEITGVVALQVAGCPEPRLPEVVRQLQGAAAYLPAVLDRGLPARRRLPAGGALESALWLVGSCLEHDHFRGAATAVATDIAAQTRCERAAIGFVDKQQVRVRALSHSADFGERMNLIRRIGAAMDEAVDQRASVVVPELEGAPTVGRSAHEELLREEGSAAACTVLLTWNDQIIGAVTLERNSPFSQEEVSTLEDTATLLGPILELKRRDDRWLLRKAWDAMRAQALKLFGPRHLGLKVAAAAIAAALLYLTLATGTFRVTAPATLEGAVMRVAVAPIDGFIVQAPARAGDLVRAGDVLAVLDDRDLRLEQRNVQSQRDQIESEYLDAMAQQKRVEMNLFATRMEQADVRLDLIAEQLARLTIVAPIDGMVVSGDLSQSIGAPVQQGDALFQVAPLDAYRLMLRVDERDVAYVQTQQRGAVVLAALPEMTHDFSVTKVTPVSSSEEGTTYFLVEAALDEATPMLRPGMEGVGKVDIERSRRIWIVTRRFTDWLRLWVWAWRGPGG
jgi:biotin carboxyl carrier protein